VLATVREVAVAIDPARSASELALTSPVVTRLTVAGLDGGKVETSHLRGSREGAAVVGLTIEVVDGSLATSDPVAVRVAAEGLLADAEIARGDTVVV